MKNVIIYKVWYEVVVELLALPPGAVETRTLTYADLQTDTYAEAWATTHIIHRMFSICYRFMLLK